MQTLHIQISSTLSSPFPRTSQRKYAQYNIVFVPCCLSRFPKEALTDRLTRSL